MKIYFRAEGGVAFFPGLAAPVEIDTDALSREDLEELEGAIETAHFFARPLAVAETSSRARDRRAYEITIERSRKRRTLRVTDPVPGELRPLVQLLRDLSRRRGPPIQ